MNLTKAEMLMEIQYYNPDYISDNQDDILSKFSEIVNKYAYDECIIDIINDHKDDCILIDTPDGFQIMDAFWIKKPRIIKNIRTNNGCFLSCSNDHLIETVNGWRLANDIKVGDSILTKFGYNSVSFAEDKSALPENVYDFEVEHTNHRYWGGSGISSHNTGKTYLCLNIVKNAINKGYHVVWFDTESAVDVDTMKRFDIDITKVNYQPVDTINYTTTILSNIVQSLKEQRSKGLEIPKLLIIIDSLGNLSTKKEMDDAFSGSEKKDMTRASEIKRLFRVVINRCGILKIPVVITNHTYKDVGSFITRDIVSGGGGSEYNPSINLMLSKAQLKEKEIKTGIIVTSKVHKSRYTKEIPIKFHISFYKGMNPFVGLQHYVDWESCGIAPGKIDNGTFIPEECADRDKAKYWAVKHLNKHIKPNELFTDTVFTKEVLENLNPKIESIFSFGDQMQIQMQEIDDIIKMDFDENTGEVLDETDDK